MGSLFRINSEDFSWAESGLSGPAERKKVEEMPIPGGGKTQESSIVDD